MPSIISYYIFVLILFLLINLCRKIFLNDCKTSGWMRFSISENMYSNAVHTGIDGHPDTNIDDLINYIDLTESIRDNDALIVNTRNK